MTYKELNLIWKDPEFVTNAIREDAVYEPVNPFDEYNVLKICNWEVEMLWKSRDVYC